MHPTVTGQTELNPQLCPEGHEMSRDFNESGPRSCECCLWFYHSSSGQWECKLCDGWGACDECVSSKRLVGHWPYAEEVDPVVTVSEARVDIESVVAAEANELLKGVDELSFMQQSVLAHGYRHFIDTMVAGITQLTEKNGPGYVVTKEDIAAIAKDLN